MSVALAGLQQGDTARRSSLHPAEWWPRGTARKKRGGRGNWKRQVRTKRKKGGMEGVDLGREETRIKVGLNLNRQKGKGGRDGGSRFRERGNKDKGRTELK